MKNLLLIALLIMPGFAQCEETEDAETEQENGALTPAGRPSPLAGQIKKIKPFKREGSDEDCAWGDKKVKAEKENESDCAWE